MKRRAPRTLMEYAIARQGFRRGTMVTSFMVAWGIAREAWLIDNPGDTFKVDDYAAWWKIDRSTAFREQAFFRETFPGETTPDRLLDLARSSRVEVVKLSPRML